MLRDPCWKEESIARGLVPSRGDASRAARLLVLRGQRVIGSCRSKVRVLPRRVVMPRLLVLGATGPSVATCCAGAHQRTVGSPVTRKGERLCSFEVTRETDHRVPSHGTWAIEVQHEGTHHAACGNSRGAVGRFRNALCPCRCRAVTTFGGILRTASSPTIRLLLVITCVFKWVTQSVQIVNNFVTVQGGCRTVSRPVRSAWPVPRCVDRVRPIHGEPFHLVLQTLAERLCAASLGPRHAPHGTPIGSICTGP